MFVSLHGPEHQSPKKAVMFEENPPTAEETKSEPLSVSKVAVFFHPVQRWGTSSDELGPAHYELITEPSLAEKPGSLDLVPRNESVRVSY